MVRWQSLWMEDEFFLSEVEHASDHTYTASVVMTVQSVWSTSRAFLAQLSDGSVIVWGGDDGGDIADVKAQLEGGIENVSSARTNTSTSTPTTKQRNRQQYVQETSTSCPAP